MIRVLIFLLLINTLYGATTVILHTESDYKPYSYLEKGKVQGIHIEIIKSIFSKMKDYSLKIKPVLWEDGLKDLNESKILMFSNLYYRPKERPFIIDYSDTYSYDTISLHCNGGILNQKLQEIDWKKDFKGLKIAKAKGFSIVLPKTLQEMVEAKEVDFIEAPHDENIDNLIAKKINCYVNDEVSTTASLQHKMHIYKESNKSIEDIEEIKSVTIFSKESVHIGFSKKYFSKRKDLIKQINLAIKVMENSGEIKAITQKYLAEFFLKSMDTISIDAVIYPMGSFISDKMDGYGVLAEIVTTAFADQNITINYQFRERNQAYLYNKWGRSCMSFPWTKREDTWLYNEISDPIMASDINFFYEKNNLTNGIEYYDLYDLKDYRLGGIKGKFYEKFFSGMSFNYSSFDNTKELLQALALKKIDVVPMNKHLFMDAVKEYMPHKIDEFAYHEKPMVKKANYILFSKKCKSAIFYLESFNKGFKNIQLDGRFDKILDKYTTSQEEKEEFEKIFRNMEKIEAAEEQSVFDVNATDLNATDLNKTDLDFSDTNLTNEESNQTTKKGAKK